MKIFLFFRNITSTSIWVCHQILSFSLIIFFHRCVPLPANACHPEVNLPSSSFLSNYFGSKPLEQFETEENSYCSTVLQWLICYYNYPFCSEESRAVIPICNESVDAVRSCEDEFIQISSRFGTEGFWAFVFSIDYISNTTSCWSFGNKCLLILCCMGMHCL